VLKIDRCDRGSPSVVAGHAGAAADFHYDGLRLKDARTSDRCYQAEPDLVVLTGDYVTDNPARFTSWYYDSNICKVALAFMPYWATTIFITPVKREGTSF